MKNSLLAVLISFNVGCVWCHHSRSDADRENGQNSDGEGFVSMFDGKTLKGWTPMLRDGGTADAWVAKDGMIVGDGDKGIGYLVYDRHGIADFEMKFTYRFPGAGNSGVNIRARPDPTEKRDFQGYHVDIGHVGIGKQVLGAWDFHTPGRREHACFRGESLVIDENDEPTVTPIEGSVTLADINKGGWNDVHVVVKGNHFKFSINGKPSAEFVEHLPPEKRLHRGMIQLQLHNPGMVVQYRDLWIKTTQDRH
ncbi:MAG: hypothetical protein M2R45_00481 [Verrucomicrobia subdivision 3 bacterium]|nr:hypothetical protein [Limisphaerales bacterium]MCS1413641.1 hypothetical protein [Limisphaerales bacterium]